LRAEIRHVGPQTPCWPRSTQRTWRALIEDTSFNVAKEGGFEEVAVDILVETAQLAHRVDHDGRFESLGAIVHNGPS